jgi:sulfoxide reductase catalytic subunit YedY
MVIKKPDDIKSSEVTEEKVYKNRRKFLLTAALAGVGAAAGAALFGRGGHSDNPTSSGDPAPQAKGPFDTTEKMNSYKDITTYNNYYEFGTDKEDPSQNAGNFKTKPWSVAVDGEVTKPATYNLEDLIKGFTLEDRIYRHRCVEAWSMVIPWRGFALNNLIKKLNPTSKAKYVRFTTLLDPEQMPGEQSSVLKWPYTEGLRMDEAMHPLAFMVTGLYGKDLPNQNGAPLRVALPWKYGFKSAKAIVRITFMEDQPQTAWNTSAPGEYGFYSNVNPTVDHPRWSQAKERRIGEFAKRDTLMFNGYADQVGSMYAGMDLRKYY